jgi:predicted TIM-barrel fold metal-dependent hydrolase
MVDELPVSADEKQQILEGNARRLFGLDGLGAA